MNNTKIETAILEEWKKDDTFKKQLEKNKNNPTKVFYDGPPFVPVIPIMVILSRVQSKTYSPAIGR